MSKSKNQSSNIPIENRWKSQGDGVRISKTPNKKSTSTKTKKK